MSGFFIAHIESPCHNPIMNKAAQKRFVDAFFCNKPIGKIRMKYKKLKPIKCVEDPMADLITHPRRLNTRINKLSPKALKKLFERGRDRRLFSAGKNANKQIIKLAELSNVRFSFYTWFMKKTEKPCTKR